MELEILNEDNHSNEKVDVYSLGVILFFILTNWNFPKISICWKKANIPDNVNDISRDLIIRCWSLKSEDCPSLNEIDEYIIDNNFK